MSYTGTEIFSMAIAVMDELSDTGAVADSQVAEYKYRAPYLLDLWQHEIRDLRATAEILRKPVRNLLDVRFEVGEHFGEDVIYEGIDGALSGVFVVDGQAEVFVEHLVSGVWENAAGVYARDGGAEIEFDGVISVPVAMEPTAFKFRLTAGGERTRVRFSGEYYYLFSNFALYRAAFPSCARVPEYGAFVRYAMPGNFDRVTQIVSESPKAGAAHRWENGRELMVVYEYEGVIKITYRPNPEKITALTQTLEISEGAAVAGAYYLAMHFALADQNTDLASLCTGKYQEIKGISEAALPLASGRIRDVYGVAGIL